MRTLHALIPIGALLLASACSSDPRQGYTFTSAYDSGVRTIAAPIFDNTSFHHGIEALLTEAIVKEIHRSTPWTVVRTDAAETTLRGAITDVTMRRLGGTGRESGLVQEMAVVMSVDFEWVDNRSGATLVARRNYRGAGTFTPAQGVGERLESGEQAAIESLARDIVGELRSQW